MKLGRETILKVVSHNLNDGQRITRALMILNNLKSTYYNYLHLKPSKTERIHDSLKNRSKNIGLSILFTAIEE